MKICSKCHIEKDASEYHLNKGLKDGLQPHCKECQKIISKQSYLNRKAKGSLPIKRKSYNQDKIFKDIPNAITHQVVVDKALFNAEVFYVANETELEVKIGCITKVMSEYDHVLDKVKTTFCIDGIPFESVGITKKQALQMYRQNYIDSVNRQTREANERVNSLNKKILELHDQGEK